MNTPKERRPDVRYVHRYVPLVGVSLTVLALGGLAIGQGHDGGVPAPPLFTPAEIRWQDGPRSPPPGAKRAVPEGDPTMEGSSTIRLKLTSACRLPPHTHPKTERLTVISGTFRLGMGEKSDAKVLRTIPAGSYGFWPAGMRQFVQVEGQAVVQLHGIGPWQIVYVNPADDPRRASE
jgi:hypothetical protein